VTEQVIAVTRCVSWALTNATEMR